MCAIHEPKSKKRAQLKRANLFTKDPHLAEAVSWKVGCIEILMKCTVSIEIGVKVLNPELARNKLELNTGSFDKSGRNVA